MQFANSPWLPTVKPRPGWPWTSSGVDPSRDDPYKSYDQLRAKLCVQTLAFKNWNYFESLCKGVVLRSRFQKAAEGVQLNMAYEDLKTKRKCHQWQWSWNLWFEELLAGVISLLDDPRF